MVYYERKEIYTTEYRQSCAELANYRKTFTEAVGNAARKDWKKRHICLPSLVIALAAEETDWGEAPEFLLRGELFPYRRDKSRERYQSVIDAICSHNTYLLTWMEDGQKRPNWERLTGQENYILAVQYLQDAEYPYHPFENYAGKLVEIIETYHLQKYD